VRRCLTLTLHGGRAPSSKGCVDAPLNNTRGGGSHYLYALPTVHYTSGQIPRLCTTSLTAPMSFESIQTVPIMASMVAHIVIGETTLPNVAGFLLISCVSSVARPTCTRLSFEVTLEIIVCTCPVMCYYWLQVHRGSLVPRVYSASDMSFTIKNRKATSPIMASRLLPSEVRAKGDPAACRLCQALSLSLKSYPIRCSRRAVFDALSPAWAILDSNAGTAYGA